MLYPDCKTRDLPLPRHGTIAHQRCNVSCFSQKSIESFFRKSTTTFAGRCLLCFACIYWQWQSIWLVRVSSYRDIKLPWYQATVTTLAEYVPHRYILSRISDLSIDCDFFRQPTANFAGMLTTVVQCISGGC